MKGLKILMFIATGCLIAGPLHADIYEWTDENGVKHFTNYAPPEDAKILMKTEELPYDEAADQARMEDERQYLLELAKLELAEKEAELARREAEADEKAAEAERYAQETMQAADQYRNDARYDRWYYRSGGYYGYYRPPYRHHYKHKYRTKSHYGYSKKKYGYKYYRKKHAYGYKYRHKKHAYPHKYRSKHSLRSRSHGTHGSYRVNARSKGKIGRSHSRRGSYGYRR